MKKLILLLFPLLAYTISYATYVPESDAQQIGYNFLQQHGITVTNQDALKLVYTSASGDVNYYYIFSADRCFVIISADDGAIPVLGYSGTRSFPAKMPSNTANWLKGYEKQLDYIISNKVAGTTDIATQWSNLKANIKTNSTARTTGVVDSLVLTTWDQSPYYNADCPGTGSAQAVTGCVATATAQVMKYWNWPTKGVGFHSYTDPTYGYQSANFGTTTYDWSAMPKYVTGSDYSAVALLMYQIGVAVEMSYGVSGSEACATIWDGCSASAESALKSYFSYVTTLHGIQRSSYTDAVWISTIEAEINAKRPVIYTGQGTAGGHCFVADGYDASNDLHINWGWGGYGPDGYYAIDALNPPALGTGGGGGGFNSDQEAIIGIQPDTSTSGGGGSTTDTISSSMYLYSYVVPAPDTIFYDNPFSVTASIWNTGTADYSGYICAAAFDTSGAFVDYIEIYSTDIAGGGVYYDSAVNFSTPGLADMIPGVYTIGIYYYNSTDSLWVAVSDTLGYTNFPKMVVYNSNYIELYEAMDATPNPLVQGSPASVTLSLYNNNTSAYSGNYAVELYNYDIDTLIPAFEINELTGMSIAADATSGTLTFTTSDVTAPPGTYLLAVLFSYSGNWYLAGSDYYENPIFINVVAPPPSPDIYEPDNTVDSAYVLPVAFSGDVACLSTAGSNFNTATDQDYYKINLPAGYNYSILAHLNDQHASADGLTYTVAAEWTYSTDGGTTWSSVYFSDAPQTINLMDGGSVLFHCSAKFEGSMGTYLLDICDIYREPLSLSTNELSNIKIYPNPASDVITIDLQQTNVTAIAASIIDLQGRKLFAADVAGKSVIALPVSSFAPGLYYLQLQTDNGIINKKITIISK